jgi:hypothetical protein
VLLAVGAGRSAAAPLLHSDAPERSAAALQAPQITATANGWDSVLSGVKAEFGRLKGLSLSGEARAETVTSGENLPADPGEEGLQAIAQSLRDSVVFRQILAPTVGLRDRGTPDARDAAEGVLSATDALTTGSAGSGLAAPGTGDADGQAGSSARPNANPRQAPQARAQQRGRTDDVLDPTLTQDDGPTLRTVLRSFVRVRHGEERQRSPSVAQSVADAAGEAGDDGLSLGERLLDSRLLGNAVQAVITQPGFYDGDNSFSLMGHGRFDMELDLSADLAGVSVSEVSSGSTVSVSLDAKPTNAFDEPPTPPQGPREHVDVYQLISGFMQTTTGMAAIIITIVMLGWLGMFKLVMWLNQ